MTEYLLDDSDVRGPHQSRGEAVTQDVWMDATAKGFFRGVSDDTLDLAWGQAAVGMNRAKGIEVTGVVVWPPNIFVEFFDCSSDPLRHWYRPFASTLCDIATYEQRFVG